MHKVLIIGAGKMGSTIAFLLAQSHDFQVYLADANEHSPYLNKLTYLPNYKFIHLNASNENAVAAFLDAHPVEAVISSLPYFCNIHIAKIAVAHQLHYFDLTEDVATTQSIQNLAKEAKTAFIPQCGLAPGFISIVANDIMQHFPKLDTVKMRVGALPLNISNALQYSLTWSTEGLINEYGNPCQALEHGNLIELQPLEGLEEIKIDGLTYEAFNTSGGVGSLVQSYLGKVKHMSYKTIRYPGHCAKIKFLMNDLKLNEDRKTLKHIFEHSIPKTYQDVVLVYVSVTGEQADQLIERSYVKKFYPKEIDTHSWSAIQLTTASSLCAVVDLVLQQPSQYQGLIKQEQFNLEAILQNRFGEYLA
jgi:saccharopine dehydrogenase-like NADP-dependent oxidoreductase